MKETIGEVMGEIIIWVLRTLNLVTSIYGQKYEIIMSSKSVRTRHYIHIFILKSLALKIHSNAGQTTGTTVKGKNNKYG